MIIKPKIRGFICTTTHPLGCEANVLEQINTTKAKGKIANGPKKVLVVGSSSGYGSLLPYCPPPLVPMLPLSGVFFEKPGTETKPGTAGWYKLGGVLTSLPRLKACIPRASTVMPSAMKPKPR